MLVKNSTSIKPKLFPPIEMITSGLKCIEPGYYYSKKSPKISFSDSIHIDFIDIEDQSFWYTHRINCLVEIFKNFHPKEPLFDIGGGTGTVCLALQNVGIDCVLVEPTNTGSNIAYKRGIKPVINTTLENANFVDSSIPSIGLFDVLEHIKNDSSFLTLLRKYLVSGGRIYITVPAYNNLWSVEDEKSGHYRRYDPLTFQNKLKSLGFKIEYATCLFSILPIPILFFRSLPSRLGLRKINSNRTINEFRPPNNSSIYLQWFLDRELRILKRKKKIYFGSSLLIIARKQDGN